MKITPVTSSYSITAKNASMYNTPPTFNIYVMGLYMKYMNQKGGIEYWQKVSQQKSSCLYEYIDTTNGFYKCPIKPHCRSRMNVVFTLQTPEMDKKFIKEAGEKGFIQLNGHRDIGGCRLSIYNGMTLEGVHQILQFMKDFQ